MTNTYELATEPIDVERICAQMRFMENHHHLINPRFYTLDQIRVKNILLLGQRWADYEAKRDADILAIDEAGAML